MYIYTHTHTHFVIFFFFFFLVWGSHPVTLRCYSWQKSLLASLGGPYGMPEIKLGSHPSELRTRQTPYHSAISPAPILSFFNSCMLFVGWVWACAHLLLDFY